MSTVVNRALLSLKEESLKITLTVPLTISNLGYCPFNYFPPGIKLLLWMEKITIFKEWKSIYCNDTMEIFAYSESYKPEDSAIL